MPVSPPKPYCHTNKRQMYQSQATQDLLSYETKYGTSWPKPYCHTNKRKLYGSQSPQVLLSFK